MRKRAARLIIFLLIAVLLRVEASYSYLSDRETASGNTMTAATWGNPHPCDSEGEDGEELSSVELFFYAREDNRAVRFLIQGTSDYDSLEYSIDYEREPDLLEHIEGTIDNSSHLDIILREWFVLGSCSGEGLVCVYHEGVEEVTLTLNLLKEGIIVETLQESLHF